ncbi:hypothetical protein C7212DRAFT_308040 [Tuber magnatum]|uniref:Uncharacterized protein n=1 Tax=Tuber magnatum TaxID=42249 RepID=A0A317SZY9_9PEZI|nr:hypothetical protein C7212DRAFT_308040 [Tuber magnatum]
MPPYYMLCSLEGRPAGSTMFLDKAIPESKGWLERHRWFGMGAPKRADNLEGVRVVAGSPYARSLLTSTEEGMVLSVQDPTPCTRCHQTHTNHLCVLPCEDTKKIPGWFFVDPAMTNCPRCDQPIKWREAGRRTATDTLRRYFE